MEDKMKSRYQSPHVEVVSVSGQELVCQSGYTDNYQIIDPWGILG